jgi:hypothetical protein
MNEIPPINGKLLRSHPRNLPAMLILMLWLLPRGVVTTDALGVVPTDPLDFRLGLLRVRSVRWEWIGDM